MSAHDPPQCNRPSLSASPSLATGAQASDDRPPVRPEKPLPMDCCESGCDRCIFDIYAQELAQYEDDLAAWHKRHPKDDPETRR